MESWKDDPEAAGVAVLDALYKALGESTDGSPNVSRGPSKKRKRSDLEPGREQSRVEGMMESTAVATKTTSGKATDTFRTTIQSPDHPDLDFEDSTQWRHVVRPKNG